MLKERIKELLYLGSVRLPLTIAGKLRGNLVRVHWGRGLHNFGDCFQPHILRHYGLLPVYVPSYRKADIIMQGSILQSVPPDYHGIIWGTGGDCKAYNFPHAEILSVRGKMTQHNFGDRAEQIKVLGDLGLLMPLVYPAPPRAEKLYDLCIIPHFVDKRHRILQSFINSNNNYKIHIVDVFSPPQDVCKAIYSSRCVFSSSLHGLILADAYNIPNLRFVIRETMPRYFYDYKFDDYYSSFTTLQKHNHSFVELNGEEKISTLRHQFISHYEQVSPLIEALNRQGKEIGRRFSTS